MKHFRRHVLWSSSKYALWNTKFIFITKNCNYCLWTELRKTRIIFMNSTCKSILILLCQKTVIDNFLTAAALPLSQHLYLLRQQWPVRVLKWTPATVDILRVDTLVWPWKRVLKSRVRAICTVKKWCPCEMQRS